MEVEVEAEVEAGVGRLGSRREGSGAPSTVRLLRTATLRRCGRTGLWAGQAAWGRWRAGARGAVHLLEAEVLEELALAEQEGEPLLRLPRAEKGVALGPGRPSPAPRLPLASRASPRRKAHARRHRRSSAHTRALPPPPLGQAGAPARPSQPGPPCSARRATSRRRSSSSASSPSWAPPAHAWRRVARAAHAWHNAAHP